MSAKLINGIGMKIYTKTGDKGQTSLANGRRVSKTDARIEAYGTADELNSFVGLLKVALEEQVSSFKFQVSGYKFLISGKELTEQLTWIQNRLFDLGACLAGADMHLDEAAIGKVEGWIDAMQSELEPLRAFVLPAGCESACRCHVCRTVTRRLERRMLVLNGENEDAKLQDAMLQDGASAYSLENELRFVNRLSDYFFVLARYCVYISGEREETWTKD